MKKLVFILLLCFCTVGFSVHEYYLSVTELRYNETAQSIEVAIKIFTDDLENALENDVQKRFYIDTEKEIEDSTNVYLADYLNRTFEVEVNEKRVEFNFLGKEAEDDAVWCYLEAENVEKPTTLRVKNAVLMEIYYTQENIIHTEVGGEKKSTILRVGTEVEVFSY